MNESDNNLIVLRFSLEVGVISWVFMEYSIFKNSKVRRLNRELIRMDNRSSVTMNKAANFVGHSKPVIIKLFFYVVLTIILTQVTCCSFSPDGNVVVSGSRDKTLNVWNTKTGLCISTLKGHEEPVSIKYIQSEFSLKFHINN